jgi:hypothetical protein
MRLENYFRHEMEENLEKRREDYEFKIGNRELVWDKFPKAVTFCLAYLGARTILGPEVDFSGDWNPEESKAGFVFHFVDRMAYSGVLLCGVFSVVDAYKKIMHHLEKKSMQEAKNQLKNLVPVRF